MTDAYVYFLKPVGLDGPIKIGCSRLPPRRLRDLMAWSPVALELLVGFRGDYRVERQIHNRFAKSHLHQEWFLPSPALLAGITALQRGVLYQEAFDLTIIEGDVRKSRLRKRTDAPENMKYNFWTGYNPQNHKPA